MKYGCIGEHLSHSFSKEIHNLLADYPYEIAEVSRERLDAFMTERDFIGINVTIPYKELVIPHLYSIDEAARAIGAVNTIVKRDGLLYGYNTDFYGMSALITHAGISIKGKSVAILGTGGTAKTARSVANALGASEVTVVSRKKTEEYSDYDELYKKASKIEIIINTTPVGMYPEPYASPIKLERFTSLTGVVDAIYNPLRTELVLEAKKRGIAAEGGLYMLVAQAVRASEIFLDIKYPECTTEAIYQKVLKSKENIVLIGMPASGKSTVGGLLSELLDRELFDTDEMIVEAEGTTIAEIFKDKGEAYFRDLESWAVSAASRATRRIIATGGGAVLRSKNVEALRQNGRLFFLNRAPESLIPTETRPLASDRDAIMKRYSERYPIYCASADEIIECNKTAEHIAKEIGENYL